MRSNTDQNAASCVVLKLMRMSVLGLGQQTVKSVAPTSAAVDLHLEMNVEPR